MPPVLKPPTRELGSTHGRAQLPSLPTWADLEPDPTERVPALLWPESTFTYPKMLDDGQVQALALGVLMPVRSQYRQVLNPGTLPPELAKALADDLDIPLKGADKAPAGRRGGRVHNGRHRASALRALWIGHAVYELVAEIDTAGIARLVKLAPRPQHTVQRWHADVRGDWTGIEQVPTLPPRPIPRDKLCVYTWGDDTDGDPRGRSLLRALYKNWNLKDRLVRIDVMSHERHGVGWAKGKITDARGTAHRDTLVDIGAGLQAGEDTSVVLPEGTDLSMEGLSGSVSDPIASARYHDEQMARALLAMVLQLGQTESGSRALGEVHMDLLGMFQAAVAAWEADTLTEQVVERWVTWNLGELGVEAGACVEAERVDDAPPSVEALATLVGAGLLQADPDLEQWIRARMGLPDAAPLPDDLTAIVPDEPVDELVEEFAAAPDHDLPMPDRELRAPTAREIAARVDPKAIDETHDETVNDLTAILMELRAILGPAAIDALRDDENVHDTGDTIAAALGDGGFADRLARRVLQQVPAAIIDRLAAALAGAGRKGAAQIVEEAARQGAPVREPQPTPPEEDHTPAAEALAIAVARDVARTVTVEAQRLAPADTPDGAAVADAVAVITEIAPAPDTDLPGPPTGPGPNDRLPSTPGAPMAPPRAVGDAAASAASQAIHEGRVRELRARETDIDDLFAMELLDGNTCTECARVDNETFDSLDDGLAAYPTGTYVRCEGRGRCRGRLVAMFKTQQD